MTTIHEFRSTGGAYDASQCDDDIKHGDVLVVPREQAVAILVEAWPVAVDGASGEEFHLHVDTWDWSSIPPVGGGAPYDLTESVALARTKLKEIR